MAAFVQHHSVMKMLGTVRAFNEEMREDILGALPTLVAPSPKPARACDRGHSQRIRVLIAMTVSQASDIGACRGRGKVFILRKCAARKTFVFQQKALGFSFSGLH
jgi:hypothetical protein